MVSYKLQYLDEMRGGKTVRYRRRWPKDIVDQMDSAVLTVYLKNKSGPKMVREHAAIEAMFDKTVQTMRERQVGLDARSPSQKFHEAALKAAGMLDEVIGLDPDDQWLRGHLADATPDPMVKEILTNPKAKPPAATVADGIAMYRTLRCADSKAKRTRLDRLAGTMKTVWGKLDKLPLADLKRVHGRDLIEHYKSHRKRNGEPLSADTIKREIGHASAVINLALRENDLAREVENPFIDVELPKANTRKGEKRKPLSDAEFAKVSDRLKPMQSELWPLWVLMSLGVHAKELCYLERQDIDLERGVIQIRPNSLRPSEMKESRDRDVPLTPTTREAAREALRLAGDGKPVDALFARYSRGERGADSLTQLLNTKHIKLLGIDNTTYGLRHRASSKLRSAGAEQVIIDRCLGHSIRGAGASVYGGDERTEQVREWLVKAGL